MTLNIVKKIVFFIVILISSEVFAQNKIPSPTQNNSSQKNASKSDGGKNRSNNNTKKTNKTSQKSNTDSTSKSVVNPIEKNKKDSLNILKNQQAVKNDSIRLKKLSDKLDKPSNKIMTERNDKIIVYQMMFHLWGNKNTTNKENGSAEENGVTKFKDINDLALQKLKSFGYSHLYMTGLIEHATMEDQTAIGIPKDHPDVVKGRSGSPFAIKDYYDVNPFFATDPKKRIQEFESMVGRVHKNKLKIIMDCVPNHLARVYHSDMKPTNIKDFGEDDDKTKSFAPYNNFYYLPNTQFQIPLGVNSPVKADAPYVEKPAKVWYYGK